MQSGVYFEFLCWDSRSALNWDAAMAKIMALAPVDQSNVDAAINVIKPMTERTFNEGGDNASVGNLSMTMETRGGAPYFGGPEKDWSDLSEGFSAIFFMKSTHSDILKAVGFLTEIEIEGGYFEVRKHLEGQYPIGDKLLREHSKLLL